MVIGNNKLITSNKLINKMFNWNIPKSKKSLCLECVQIVARDITRRSRVVQAAARDFGAGLQSSSYTFC